MTANLLKEDGTWWWWYRFSRHCIAFITTRQFTCATHCSLCRTKIIWLFNREGIKKTILHFRLLHTLQTHRLRTNSLTTFSSREGINYRCRRFYRSCRRSCCRRSDGPLAINRDHSNVVAAQFIAVPAGRWRWTMTALTGITGSIQLITRVGDAVFAIVLDVFRV